MIITKVVVRIRELSIGWAKTKMPATIPKIPLSRDQGQGASPEWVKIRMSEKMPSISQ